MAEVLRDFLSTVFGSDIDPFISSSDIDAGEQWAPRLTQELKETSFGIICLTPENINNQWIHFEAGALSKEISHHSFVCPYLLSLKMKDLEYPLK